MLNKIKKILFGKPEQLWEIKSPERFDLRHDNLNYKNVSFLAGGISGTSDWQSEFINKIRDVNTIIFNPRREEFFNSEASTKDQIKWEHIHFNIVEKNKGLFIFWFSPETLCPIVLFEFGKYIRQENLLVGCHPEYQKKLDIKIQLSLERPEIKLIYSLDELAENFRNFYFDGKEKK